MHGKVAVATLALAVPAFLWPPKPARAAETDVATQSAPLASSVAAR
jgi:hypothetical protein